MESSLKIPSNVFKNIIKYVDCLYWWQSDEIIKSWMWPKTLEKINMSKSYLTNWTGPQ